MNFTKIKDVIQNIPFSICKSNEIENITNQEIRIKNEKNKYDDKYDIIIDANSIRYLNKEGWRIIYNGNEKDIKDFIVNQKKKIIAVLGNSNRGKTHILQKLSGVNIKPGYQVQTKGLSIKIYNKENMLLDTAGTNAPLLKENGIKPSQKEINDIYLCQIITNYILQTFIVKTAHILICVVGMLTASEQQFLNKIKNICKNEKKLIVIHNLIHCKTNKDIQQYVDETLLKNITCKLEEAEIPFFEEKYQNLFKKYYKEEGHNNIRHFIYVNDEGDSKEMNYYNQTTLKFINKVIGTEQKKSVNIIKNLREHVKEFSSFALTTELKSITESEDLNLIKCTEPKFEPKRVLADEFDNIIFIGKDFEPSHRYYKTGNSFVIEIDLCSKYKDLKVKKTFDDNAKIDKFEISGERIVKINTNKLSFYDYVDKREKYKKFKLEIKLKKSDYKINYIYNEFTEKMKYGVLFLTFKIKNKLVNNK